MARSRQWIWTGAGAAAGGLISWLKHRSDEAEAKAALDKCLADNTQEGGVVGDIARAAMCGAATPGPIFSPAATVFGGLLLGGAAGWIAQRVTR